MPELHDRVRVETTTGGCYHKKTGTVTKILTGNRTPRAPRPEGSLNRYPYWFRVTFDEPADNGGTPVESEIFLNYELKVLHETG